MGKGKKGNGRVGLVGHQVADFPKSGLIPIPPSVLVIPEVQCDKKQAVLSWSSDRGYFKTRAHRRAFWHIVPTGIGFGGDYPTARPVNFKVQELATPGAP
jgi:hypothetical protein